MNKNKSKNELSRKWTSNTEISKSEVTSMEKLIILIKPQED